MKIIEINSPEQLDQYIDDWNKLLDGVSECSTIFLTPEWSRNWWKYFGDGNELSVLMLFEDEQPVGIAPLIISQSKIIRILRFLGNGDAEHMDFYIKPEYRDTGMTRIFEYIMADLKWNVIDLIDIPDDSKNITLLRELFSKHKLLHSIQTYMACPYLKVNGHDWQTYYSKKRSRSTRQDLRRRMRRLGEVGHLEFRRYEDPTSVREIFPQLFAVHKKRWKDKHLSANFAGETEQLFFPEMTTALSLLNRLHLLTLELDGRVVAFTLSTIKEKQFTWLVTAHDPEFEKFFPGELALVRLLEDAFEHDEVSEIDFTRGDEFYKYKWANGERYNLRILACNRGLLSKLIYFSVLSSFNLRREINQSKFLRKVKENAMEKLTRIYKK